MNKLQRALLRRAAVAARRNANRDRDNARWKDAAAGYRQWLLYEPGDYAIWIQLGHMLSEDGDYEGANAAYARAARMRDDDPDLLICWAHSRKRAGDLERAADLYRRSHAIDGNSLARDEAEAIERRREPSSSDRNEHHVEAEREEQSRHEEDDLREGGSSHDEPPAHARAAATDRPFQEARYTILKEFRLTPGAEIGLFVTHSTTGALKPHVLPYLRALRAQNIEVVLIAACERPFRAPPEVLDLTAGLMVRENGGYDFAAWAHALYFYPELYGASRLYLLNDSVFPNTASSFFPDLIQQVRGADADIVGLTESFEYSWHLQSYFLALGPDALSRPELQRFFGEMRSLSDMDEVIRRYEVPLARLMEEAGCTTTVLFPSRAPLNPTLFGLGELLANGFPFVKIKPLQAAFANVDTGGWRAMLAAHGFDVDLLDAVLRSGDLDLPWDGDRRLVAHPLRDGRLRDRPLRVAFYGPWNFDNGLGAASRGIIAALRRLDVQLNLHPIKKQFHIHRQLGPAVDLIEFNARPDVAIVHLNPDSWHLLTDEQRERVREADRRIGYWVWEMAHIPDAWWHEFSSVDRIWSPSLYCAELFEAQNQAPVDIVPHVVPVGPEPEFDRGELLAGLGLPADKRIILFVFDGSSYILRKNPAALVQAFASSNLVTSGWTLVLKVKHLMDRPAEGAALKRLVDSVPGAVLLDRTMTTSELRQLMHAADIYASPHCSEGFGLTIAEAMAAGKPVVATDFGGSVDFLTPETGYPVPAHAWTLDADFGHYTRGGTWARVDVPALCRALRAAAADVESGASSVGIAARERIASQLSHEAVAAAIQRSLTALVERGGYAPKAPRVHVDGGAGLAVETGRREEGVTLVALAPDGSVPEGVEQSWAGLADDDWVLFAPSGSRVTPDYGRILADHAAARRDVSIFYADDVAGEAREARDQVRRKPDFDATLLAAQDYIGAPVAVRAAALRKLDGPSSTCGTAAVADLLHRAHAAGIVIARIPQVMLAHPGARVRARDADFAAMLRAQPAFRTAEFAPGFAPGSVVRRRSFDAETAPPVSLVIPTRGTLLPRGEGSYVERLLDGIAKVRWPAERLSVIVGDDRREEPGWARRDWPFELRRIATPRAESEPFNYAAKMNRLWRSATTEQLVFLNDDVAPLDPDWLRALMSFAVDLDVGGVGAQLFYADGTLQHAGMVPHGSGAAHAWLFRRSLAGTYQDWALVQREWSMVTGAVFATRRSLMDEVNGFDEALPLEFNDTDLCLRLRMLGHRIVYNPDARFEHAEKASRGEQLPPGASLARFRARWSEWLTRDPSWHPRLRMDHLEVTPVEDEHVWYG